MRKGDRKVILLPNNDYLYINSLGEKIIFYKIKGQEEFTPLDSFYYELDAGKSVSLEFLGEPVSGAECSWEVKKRRNFKYFSGIGLMPNFTDFGKNKASLLILLDDWYKEYGYPKNK